jgi:general stress protein 26
MTDKDKHMSTQKAVDEIWDLAKSLEICMFITWDGEHQRARPLAARPDRDEGRIFFLTDAAGAKDEQIERFPAVTLAFADIRGHDYAVITGKASVSNDRGKIAEIWTAPDKAWWDSADDPSIRLISVEPEDGELWKGPSRIVAAAKILSSAVTGAKVSFGENRKVSRL